MSFRVGIDAYARHVGRHGAALSSAHAQAAGVRTGERALDVGCGPGVLLAELAGRLGAERVAGVDPSEPFVDAARAAVPGADVRFASAEELPFVAGTFDVALSQLVVNFMSDAPTGIAEMRRVARRAVTSCVWDYAGAVIEGVMGLFDGIDGKSDRGSSAEMAKLLGLPVLLVIDASAMARSAAALIHGYTTFDPGLRVAGAILNNVGGEIHAEMIRDAVAGGVSILGALPRAKDLVVPERHLGLHLPHETRAEYVDQLATLIEEHIDLDALLANSAIERRTAPAAAAPSPPPRIRLALARDEAFCFYYTDNLELLEQAGAELVPFSPIDEPLPENIDGIYLGGGYSELHADKLAANASTREAIREFASAGGPIYAECGGLMYLAQTLEIDGETHPLCGVLPFSTAMPAPLAIGYVEVTTTGGPFGSGQTARGHLFHHSAIAGEPATDRCYELKNSRGEETQEGYLIQNVLASYAHLHLASNPALASAFIDQCASFRTGGGAHRTATVDVAS